jgi:tetratricopeptide (TPR) repeat protein
MLTKSLIDRSISSALNQNWQDAVDINLEILESDPYHIPTLNRLAKAYREQGFLDKAIRTYKQVLKLDRYNQIAIKNINLLEKLDPTPNSNGKKYNTEFIGEPGKTKAFPLVRLGDPSLLQSLEAGQIVEINIKKHYICITTQNNEHIGALTDDISYHLKQCVKLGYCYQSTIKSIASHQITVFIRETSRPNQINCQPTFL